MVTAGRDISLAYHSNIPDSLQRVSNKRQGPHTSRNQGINQQPIYLCKSKGFMIKSEASVHGSTRSIWKKGIREWNISSIINAHYSDKNTGDDSETNKNILATFLLKVVSIYEALL